MTWHLKDRELEKKLMAIDPEFVNLLNNFVGNEPNNKIFYVRFSTDIEPKSGFKKVFFVRFLASELTDEYDPHAWNEYPTVTPPEGVIMRTEFCSKDEIKRAIGIFKNGEWWFELDGKPSVQMSLVSRFRPWEE